MTKNTKIRWSDLELWEQEYFIKNISNGCGAGGGWMNRFLDKYLYGKQKKASCDIHDYEYMAGGDWIDFLRAQFIMFAKQIEDSMDKRDTTMFLLSFVYAFSTTLAGVPDYIYYKVTGRHKLFRWGRYLTKGEIFGFPS